jgi:hypothetical protein
LQAQLAAPQTYADSCRERLAELVAEQSRLARATAHAESAWLEATESLELQLLKLGAG